MSILIIFFFYFIFKIRAFFKGLGKKSLLDRNKTIKKLKRLSWDDFELLCMEFFEKNGWHVKGNEKKGADGGVDIWMHKKSMMQGQISAIVQCKRYDEALVTIKVIREMYGLMYEHNINKAYIVTTSRFTKECYKFVEEKNIELIDGSKLVEMIN
jgi:restriction system protein